MYLGNLVHIERVHIPISNMGAFTIYNLMPKESAARLKSHFFLVDLTPEDMTYLKLLGVDFQFIPDYEQESVETVICTGTYRLPYNYWK